MSKVLLVVFVFLSVTSSAQLWVADFDAEANNATSGTAGGTLGGTWSVTTIPSGGAGSFSVAADAFRLNNTGGEGVWESNTMNIASVGYAIISADILIAGFGFSDSDYLRFYYSVDGGPEVLFDEVLGSIFSATTGVSAIVAGNTVKVIVRGVDNSFFGIVFFDNVTVTAAPVIYSRQSGSWTNTSAVTGTWSLVSHTGARCSCVPLNTQVAVIGNGHTVTLPSNQTTIGTPPTTNLAPGAVDVRAASTLSFNTSGVTLGVLQGLFRVRSGGTVSSSSVLITGETISFNAAVGGALFQVDAGATASIEDLTLAAAATDFHYLTGGGSLTITDDILINANGGSLTNNFTGTISIGDRLDFLATNGGFINNQTLTIPTVNFDNTNSSVVNNATLAITTLQSASNADDDNVFTNSASGTLALGTVNANNADFDLLNSGTINQTGNFNNIDAADTNFDNLGTGTWNWSLTPNNTYDNTMNTVLNCTAAGNTFNYSGSAVLQSQAIIPTTYYNLTLSNGVLGPNKTTSAALDVTGNLLIQNSATLSSGANAINVDGNITIENSGILGGTGNITIGGDWSAVNASSFTETGRTVTFDGTSTQSITNGAGLETFVNLTTSNSFGITPQLTFNDDVTVSGTLTMLDGNIDLTGTTLRLTNTAATALSHSQASGAGWMYNGFLARSFLSTGGGSAITINTAAGLFPMGTAANWRPLYLGKPNLANSGGTLTVSHNGIDNGTSVVSIVDGASTVTRRSNSFWIVTRTSGFTSGTTTSQIMAGGTGFGVVGSINDLRLTQASSEIGSPGTNAGNTTTPLVHRITLSPSQLTTTFYLGSVDAVNSPLPVELLYFTASLNHDVVRLDWSTASELNNNFFTIERASDIEKFEAIGEPIEGAGTTNERRDYSIIDDSPLYGRSYYRLKQTDFDGKFTYSDVKVVDYEGPRFAALKVYPNPFKGGNLTVIVTGLKEQNSVPVRIYNTQGQLIYSGVFDVVNPGTIKTEIEFGNQLRSGVYIIRAGQTLQLTQKFFVE